MGYNEVCKRVRGGINGDGSCFNVGNSYNSYKYLFFKQTCGAIRLMQIAGLVLATVLVAISLYFMFRTNEEL